MLCTVCSSRAGLPAITVPAPTPCLLTAVCCSHCKAPLAPSTHSFPLLALRGFFGFASLSLWYLTLTLLPLSDANALSFVSPVRASCCWLLRSSCMDCYGNELGQQV